MTDLDKIKACARAMGHDRVFERGGRLFVLDFYGREVGICNPLENAAQADALEGWLLERGRISIEKNEFYYKKLNGTSFFFDANMTVAENRRRARVECVAKMMEGV